MVVAPSPATGFNALRHFEEKYADELALYDMVERMVDAAMDLSSVLYEEPSTTSSSTDQDNVGFRRKRQGSRVQPKFIHYIQEESTVEYPPLVSGLDSLDLESTSASDIWKYGDNYLDLEDSGVESFNISSSSDFVLFPENDIDMEPSSLDLFDMDTSTTEAITIESSTSQDTFDVDASTTEVITIESSTSQDTFDMDASTIEMINLEESSSITIVDIIDLVMC